MSSSYKRDVVLQKNSILHHLRDLPNPDPALGTLTISGERLLGHLACLQLATVPVVLGPRLEASFEVGRVDAKTEESEVLYTVFAPPIGEGGLSKSFVVPDLAEIIEALEDGVGEVILHLEDDHLQITAEEPLLRVPVSKVPTTSAPPEPTYDRERVEDGRQFVQMGFLAMRLLNKATRLPPAERRDVVFRFDTNGERGLVFVGSPESPDSHPFPIRMGLPHGEVLVGPGLLEILPHLSGRARMSLEPGFAPLFKDQGFIFVLS